jgi:tetratricopeptide (TPR) repeat protein
VREGIPLDYTTSQEVRELPPALQPDMPSLENPDELYTEALQLSRNNQLEEALVVFDHVLQLDSTNYKAWNSRGIAFARLRQYQEAKSSFSRSLAINPAYQEAANNLDRVKGLLGAPSQKEQGDTGQAILLSGSTDEETGSQGSSISCPHCGTEMLGDETGTCLSCGKIIRERAKSPELKSPLLAAIMSFLIPGLGQMYTGNTLRGILLLIGAFVGFIILLVPGFIVLAYAVYDAYKTAKKINSGQVPYKKVNVLVMIAFVIVAILMSIVLFALISAFIFGIQAA